MIEVLWVNGDNPIQECIIEAWKRCGCNVSLFHIKDCKEYAEIRKQIKDRSCYLVFSIDYEPLIARACDELGIKYASWIYNQTSRALYTGKASALTNYIFVADYSLYMKLKRKGNNSVYYLPWGAQCGDYREKKEYDVTYVGSLYEKERLDFDDKSVGMENYAKGYLHALMEMQSAVDGEYFIENLLDKDVISSLERIYPVADDELNGVSKAWVYANDYLAENITGKMREKNIRKLSERQPVILFDGELKQDIPGVENKGSVPETEAIAEVYAKSKINLNMTPKNMESGIPLEAMTIMGNGGFLLSNYQADLMNFFVPGEDYIYFTDAEDLTEKVVYYLEHDKERESIARNGYEKVRQFHTFESRIATILQMMFSEQELVLLESIKELEVCLRKEDMIHNISFSELKNMDNTYLLKEATDEYFAKRESIREISFLVKKQMMEHMNELLAEGTIEAWNTMILWYKRVGRWLSANFGEFYVLARVLQIYTEEWEGYVKRGIPVSVFQFHSMDEMMHVFYKTLFLCRRMEYGMEPEDEIIEYIEKRKLTWTFVNHVIENTQIDNKEKVRRKIEERYANR